MEVIIYTATFGGRDRLQPPFHDGRHVCFTDRQQACHGWEVRIRPRMFQHAKRESGLYKLLAHQWLPKADVTIWHDANVRLVVESDELVACLGEDSIAVLKHPKRDCIMDEARAVVAERQVNLRQAKAQVDRYRERGYPERNGLAETAVLVRRNDEIAALLNEAWWAELCRHTERDQLSFNFVCWLYGIPYVELPVDDVRTHKWFQWWPHGGTPT